MAILLARVLNADHCLQASIVTALLELAEDLRDDAAGFLTFAASFLGFEAAAFFTGAFFLADAAFFVAGAGFLAVAGVSFLPAATRVDRRVPAMMILLMTISVCLLSVCLFT